MEVLARKILKFVVFLYKSLCYYFIPPMSVKIHHSWQAVLSGEFEKPYWQKLTSFVKTEYSQTPCFPKGGDIFRALDLTPFDTVKVVIL